MENESSSSLFNLSVDPLTKTHLADTAKWARFLAIVGMVSLGIAAIGILVFAFYMSSFSGSFDSQFGNQNSIFGAGLGVGIAVFYIILLAVWFFPLLFLLRFANQMRVALAGNDQQALQLSVQNLKICFRYVGIITIIILALYALVIVFSVLGLAMSSM